MKNKQITSRNRGQVKGANRERQNSCGFTLIEIVIAVAVGVSILTAAVGLYSSIVHSRATYQAEMEVETEGLQAMDIMTQSVRNALAITSPATSTYGSTLTLVASSTANPTIFSASGTYLKMAAGSSVWFITGSSTSLAGLTFSNLSASSTVGIVRIQFTLTEGAYSKIFLTSAALRSYKQ